MLWGLLGVAACGMIWYIGFYRPQADIEEHGSIRSGVQAVGTVVAAERKEPQEDAPAAPTPSEPSQAPVSAPAETKKAPEPNQTQPKAPASEPNAAVPDPNKAGESSVQGEALNLKDVEMKLIVQKIADWTGKVVIPTDAIMKEKITIYSPGRLPRKEALEQIYGALRIKGYTAEQTDKTIYLRPIGDARLGMVPTIAPDQPLASIENKEQIVQKFFRLASYSPTQMAQIVQPLIGEYGHISADEAAASLLVIDTVGNLMRIETIIAQFDVPEADQLVTEIFQIRNRAPGEIVQLLQTLLSEGPARGGAQSWRGLPAPGRQGQKAAGAAASSVVVAGSRKPMLLIPEPRFSWIIAKASSDDLVQIRTWIERLDRPVPTVTEEESLDKIENRNQIVQRFIKLKHCTVSRMTEIISPMIGESGHVTAEEQTSTLMLTDTVENLVRVEKVISQFDVAEQDETVTEVFELQHRNPEEIASLLEAVLGAGLRSGTSGRSDWASRTLNLMRSRPRGGGRPSVTAVTGGSSGQPVLFIPEPNRKWIIVKAMPEDLEVVRGWIRRLDKPTPTITADHALADIEAKNQVVQRFVKLKHYDAARMSEIVSPLLSESGHVTAEGTTGTLLLIDSVENLIRVEAVVAQFDVPETEHVATQIFEVRHRTPDEIIVLLETVLSAGTNNSGYGGRGQYPSRPYRPGGPRGRSASGGTSSVITGAAGKSITLAAETKQGWIIAKASPDDMAEIGRWIERLDQAVTTVTADTPLSTIENKNQVVQKCIKLESYSPSQMGEIILPLLSESGYVSADESTGNLLVIDTVENLIRVEAIIEQFDIPEAQRTMTQVFNIANADPAEVVQLLRMLLSDTTGRNSYGPGYGGRPGNRGSSMNSRLYRGGMSGGAASVIMGPSSLPVVLIPEPKRKWIIARASAEDMQLITEWIAKFDRVETVEREYETVAITYADVREVATRINEALQQMPGTELQASVLVQSLDQARQIMVFGRQDLREMVKKLIVEIDVPPGQFETKHFQLQHADPDQIKRNIDELFGEGAMASRTASYSSYRPYGARGGLSPDTVKAMSHVALKQVTVIASPENMKKIGEQIALWDVAINVDEVKPRIIELRNSEPAQMATLLNTLFSQSTNSRSSIFDYLFGSSSQDKRRIVGPLYGQLTFEEVTGAKKLIVISNIPGAYDVVEELIRELDGREAAETPKVVRLNYANPETLSERLNAMFNEAGTSATIRLSDHGLSSYSMDEGSTTGAGGNTANRSISSSRNETAGGEYRPWWTTGRRAVDEMPISNIIGRVRFIPESHSRSILVLSPPEFMESIEAMIADLDVPGKQVMLKAIIMQVDHQNMTSLGVQLSSDASRWETLDNENALVAKNTLTRLEQHGSLVISPQTGIATGDGSAVQINLNINALVDFLVRELDAKILNQQTLWTKDNEEAQFFKGQRVGFQTRVSISDTGGRATSDFEYEKVGMTLRARPSITPERNVDMIINVILSQLTSEVINSQRVRTELDTTTNMVVQDGQTIMLGGMLFQEDSRIKRKIPLLGDLPLVGGLFRHRQNALANSELLIFVTPQVIDTPTDMRPAVRKELDDARRKLKDIREQLGPPADPNALEPQADADASAAAKKEDAAAVSQ
jgi:general secretion pathway protein D